MHAKLRTCDTDLHISMVDLIDDEETVLEEQIALDARDDHIESMTLRIQKLIALLKPSPDIGIDNRKILIRSSACRPHYVL